MQGLSPRRIKLWAYTDLIGLRIIHCFVTQDRLGRRSHPRRFDEGSPEGLGSYRQPGPWSLGIGGGEMVRVDRSGKILVGRPDRA